MSVERLDPSDDAAFTAFVDAYQRANHRPIDQPWSGIELREKFTGDEYVRHPAVVARDAAGAVVGGGWIGLPQRDNVSTAVAEVAIAPEHRRQGYGSAVLDVLLDIARADGRGTVVVETLRPTSDPTGPGREFALARGFFPDTTVAQRELALPVEVAPAQPRDGYRLATWRGAPPPEWLDQYARLRRLMNSEAPAGEVRFEEEYWDAERLGHEAESWAKQGRIAQVVVAIAPDGELAGHTQLVFPSGQGDEVFQWDTLVLPAHRGHGLGLAVKQQAMVESADLLVGRRRIVTWNDASNAPMIAVNEVLGYRQTAWADQFALRLTPGIG